MAAEQGTHDKFVGEARTLSLWRPVGPAGNRPDRTAGKEWESENER